MKRVKKYFFFVMASIFLMPFFCQYSAYAMSEITWQDITSSISDDLSDDGNFLIKTGLTYLTVSDQTNSISFRYDSSTDLITYILKSGAQSADAITFDDFFIEYLISHIANYYDVDYTELLENFSNFGISLDYSVLQVEGQDVAKINDFSIDLYELHQAVQSAINDGSIAPSDERQTTDILALIIQSDNTNKDIDVLLTEAIKNTASQDYIDENPELLIVEEESTEDNTKNIILVAVIAGAVMVVALIVFLFVRSNHKAHKKPDMPNGGKTITVVLAICLCLNSLSVCLTPSNVDAARRSKKAATTTKLASISEINSTNLTANIGNLFSGIKNLFGTQIGNSIIRTSSSSKSYTNNIISALTKTSKTNTAKISQIFIPKVTETVPEREITATTSVNRSFINTAQSVFDKYTKKTSSSSSIYKADSQNFIRDALEFNTSNVFGDLAKYVELDGNILSTLNTDFSKASIGSLMDQIGNFTNKSENPKLYTFLFGNHDGTQFANDAIKMVTDFFINTGLYNREKISTFASSFIQSWCEADFDTLDMQDMFSYLTELVDEIAAIYGSDVFNRESTVTISTIGEMSKFVQNPSYNSDYTNSYPIGIGVVTINGVDYSGSNNAVLVSLSGTNFVEGQAYGVISDALSAWEQDSGYLQGLKNALTEFYAANPDAPKDVFITGMSLGGMLTNNFLGETDFISQLGITIKNTAAVASPLLNYKDRNSQAFLDVVYGGTKESKLSRIRRIININDVVPYFSRDFFEGNADNIQLVAGKSMLPTSSIISNSETLRMYTEGNDGPNYKDASYKRNLPLAFLGTHTIGYVKFSEWNHYDALGYYSNACLNMNFECEEPAGYYDGLTAWKNGGGNLNVSSEYSNASDYHTIVFKYKDIMWYPAPSVFTNTILSTIE